MRTYTYKTWSYAYILADGRIVEVRKEKHFDYDFFMPVVLTYSKYDGKIHVSEGDLKRFLLVGATYLGLIEKKVIRNKLK